MIDTFKTSLSESERAEFEERAAILEYEAGYTRAEAEAIVKNWILRTRQLKNSNARPVLAPQIDWTEEK